jgi:hypothetical protein
MALNCDLDDSCVPELALNNPLPAVRRILIKMNPHSAFLVFVLHNGGVKTASKLRYERR